MEERISILNGEGERLAGLKSVPETLQEKNPAALLVHGFHYNKGEDGMFDDLARLLSGRGVIVYRFDFSGCGESEGDFQSKNLTKHLGDLRAMLETVSSDPRVDSTRIGVIAQSAGTDLVIALHPDVRWIAFLGTIAHPKEMLSTFFGSGYNPDGLSIRYGSISGKTVIEPSFWSDLDRYDMLALVKQIHCPVLFLHGADDDIIPPSETDAIFAVANESKEKAFIKNADHGMKPNRQGMYERLLGWVASRM